MNNNLYTLEGILLESVTIGAADINITENEFLSFRIKNDIKIYNNIFLTKTLIIKFIRELTSSNTVEINLYRGEEFDGSYVLNDKYFYRFNLSLTNMKIHMSIRKLIDEVPDFKKVQLDDKKITPYLNKLNSLENGLFLLVGATGSGKTTTVVTLLDYINKENSIKTISLESPIEYYFQSNNYKNSIIIQKEVGKDTLTFYSGLVAAMRQNPDVIFVGEIRDKETAEAALQAGLTGHTVIATLHANSIEKTRERMKFLLENITNDFSFIRGIISQKLIKIDNNIIADREVWITDEEKI